MEEANAGRESFLKGVRILELSDELGEYAGLLLAGLGADVIKVEPPGGERTRTIGPYWRDRPHPNRSLHFWHYNFGKRSIVLDLDSADGRGRLKDLARTADVIVETREPAYLSDRGCGYEGLSAINPGIVYARISPFGDTGPWSVFKASDLVHLALGGVVMNCGYDPQPSGVYDTPPVAPQMWHAYHVAGELTGMQILAALIFRATSGHGQRLSTSIHDAVSKSTETDLPDWIYTRLPHKRLTCRHSFAQHPGSKSGTRGVMAGISRTKDGRWILPYRTYLSFGNSVDAISRVLGRYGLQGDLADAKYSDPEYSGRPGVVEHISAMVDGFVASYLFERDVWRDGQEEGMAWAPVRRPEENIAESHWAERGALRSVGYPELGETYVQVGAKWFCPEVPWRSAPRAPMLGEHTQEILWEERDGVSGVGESIGVTPRPLPQGAGKTSKRGKPFALSGVRVIDLGWFLASAGAGRFLSAHGAEVIKIEHRSRFDAMRFGLGRVPDGGREERERSEKPITPTPTQSPNRSGAFMEINSGKRSFSLNLKHALGRQLLADLIRTADIVIDGFSPGTLEGMGFGYERLREIKPGIIYVQQTGMGQFGSLGKMHSFGPTAQAFSGLSEMSGLPEPYPPAGIGYSFLDWFGAYQMATAMMAALFRQRKTGQGCWIDSSQTEAGIYLTGSAILDYSANGRRWSRFGNRSPFIAAAPHGVYRTKGEDRWIAIAAFTQEQWVGLIRALGCADWASDPRFITLAQRVENQDDLDVLVGEATQQLDGYELMADLQQRGVPSGVCQTAADRCERDPQLRHLGWLVELEQEEIGRWPVREVPVDFSETPPYIGGFLDRSGPSYAQDNDYVLRSVLGLSDSAIQELVQAGAL